MSIDALYFYAVFESRVYSADSAGVYRHKTEFNVKTHSRS